MPPQPIHIHQVIVHKVDRTTEDGLELSDLESPLDDKWVQALLREHIAEGTDHIYTRKAIFLDDPSLRPSFLTTCDALLTDPGHFVQESHEIATHLHRCMDRRTSPGDLLVLTYSRGERASPRSLALLKMDSEAGLRFERRTDAQGNSRTVLTPIPNLLPIAEPQKCAFILHPDLRESAGHDLKVLDLQVGRGRAQRHISTFFTNCFLQCRLAHDPATTARILARRVNFRCSNPNCRKATCGPHTDPTRAVSIGVMAHITAASPGGPRYDPGLTRDQRWHPDNGIWLCQTCAKLVDIDQSRYAAEILREWKRQAERAALEDLSSSHRDKNWPEIIRARCRKILVECDEAPTSSTKGRLLEDLVEMVFTSHDSLVLAGKRVSTGDEEIDLVFMNNVDRPFWLALGSPLLLVECKNWSKPIGSSELRDFEGKLRNHTLAKIGFLVSLNGFTSRVRNELMRMGRDECHVVLIDREDILDYLTTDIALLSWLETRISRLY